MALSSILILSDSVEDRQHLADAIQRVDVKAHLQAAQSLEEAQHLLAEPARLPNAPINPTPDILLLDWDLPRNEGETFLQWARNDARVRTLSVHVLTLSGDQATIQRAYSLQANSVSLKPVDVNGWTRYIKAVYGWHQFALTSPLSSREETSARAHSVTPAPQ